MFMLCGEGGGSLTGVASTPPCAAVIAIAAGVVAVPTISPGLLVVSVEGTSVVTGFEVGPGVAGPMSPDPKHPTVARLTATNKLRSSVLCPSIALLVHVSSAMFLDHVEKLFLGFTTAVTQVGGRGCHVGR